jgi:F0F1-type ATP synthase membrane subunit b/b'
VYERQVLGAARDESHKALEQARTQVQTQAATAKKTLETQASVLARQMAKKILGREVA